MIFLTTKCVPLHNRGGFKLRKRIIGEPILSQNLYGGIPGMSREFKNSIGKFTDPFSSSTVSIGNNYCIWKLISPTSTFFPVKGALYYWANYNPSNSFVHPVLSRYSQ